MLEACDEKLGPNNWSPLSGQRFIFSRTCPATFKCWFWVRFYVCILCKLIYLYNNSEYTVAWQLENYVDPQEVTACKFVLTF